MQDDCLKQAIFKQVTQLSMVQLASETAMSYTTPHFLCILLNAPAASALWILAEVREAHVARGKAECYT